MPSDLELSLFRTVAYFSYFRYPLTSFELWKWLLEPEGRYSFAAVVEVLSSSSFLKERLKYESGFYGIGMIKEDLNLRRERLLNAMQKYVKLRRIMKMIGWAPYVDGAAVCNSLAFHHTQTSSDIDLFLVAAPGRVWTARFFSTLPLILMRERPGEREKDPVCLSFFATPEAFDFEKLKIGERDPYLAYWAMSLIPLLDRTLWTKDFFETNAWLKSVLPNAYPVKRARAFRLQAPVRIPSAIMSEELAKKVQEERFPGAINDLKNRDTRVVVNHTMLKFHEHDRRAEIFSALEEEMNTV
jgi:hypothetical protein